MSEVRNQFDKETKYFFSDRNYREYSSWLEAQHKALLEALKEKEVEIERLKEVLNVIKLIITKYRRLDTKTQNN